MYHTCLVMSSSLSCSGVLTASVTRLALILPHWEYSPMPITRARHSSPSVTRHDDSRKQSFSRCFFRSSGSPVSDDSLDRTKSLLRIIESAGMESPAFRTRRYEGLVRQEHKRFHNSMSTCKTRMSPTTRSFGLMRSMVASRRTEQRSSLAEEASRALNCSCFV
jgi:hypothetical protein